MDTGSPAVVAALVAATVGNVKNKGPVGSQPERKPLLRCLSRRGLGSCEKPVLLLLRFHPSFIAR